jgi:undecaprenyl-phosphate alpha-N-acetylglucosaminyl 1-phosphatetransferase
MMEGVPKIYWMGLACLLAAMAIPLLTPLARRFGLVDHPHGHKTHDRSVPLVGGLGVFLAVGVVAIPAGLVTIAGWPWVLAVLAMLVLGVIDDLRPLSARVRFVWQIGVALLLIFGAGHRLVDLGDLVGQGTLALEWLAIPFTVFCVVGVINAFNMIDGLDGLSGSIALISLIALAYLAALSGHSSVALAVSLVAGALVGFLAFNWPREGGAPVFLGNGGSLALGTVLAFLFVDLSQAPYRALAPVGALWLFAIPLIDTVSVMLRRLQEGVSPFKPDHNHVHHLLLRAGFSGPQTLWMLIGITAICALVAVLGVRLAWSQSLLALGFLLLGCAYHGWAMRAIRRNRLLGRPLAPRVVRSQS